MSPPVSPFESELDAQLDRYLLGQTLGRLKVGDFEVFTLKPGETSRVAACRIRSLLHQWRPTYMFKWAVSHREDYVVVRKTGSWTRSDT